VSLNLAEQVRWLRSEHHTLSMMKDRVDRAAEEKGDTDHNPAYSRRNRTSLYDLSDALAAARDQAEATLDRIAPHWDDPPEDATRPLNVRDPNSLHDTDTDASDRRGRAG
jgi:hypothetical protein